MTINSADLQEKGPLSRWGIFVILALFLFLAAAYSVINPIHEATDELRHYRFVRIISTEGRLPVQGQEPCRAQSHHPPLYYALAALPTALVRAETDICDKPDENPFWAYRYWEVGSDNKNQYLHTQAESFPWYGDALAAHIARGVNILIGAAVVLLTWATARVIWPGRDGLAAGAAALVAFNPMFLYMSAAINNDVIAALAGAAITYLCIRLLNDQRGLNWRWGVFGGLIFGLALLSKFNLAAAIVLIQGAFIWTAWKKGQWLQWIASSLLLIGVSFLISGWWFIRNQVLYGEPTGFQQVTELWGVRQPLESFGLALSELPYAFTTLWGRFGFGQIPLPNVIYVLLLVLVLLGLGGALLGWLLRSKGQERWGLTFLFADVLLFFLVLFNYMLVSPAGPNGRFFFPAISSFAILILYGLGQLIFGFNSWLASQRSEKPLSVQAEAAKELNAARYSGILVSLGMFLLALVALLAYLRPAYARPSSFSLTDDIPNPIEINFDQLAALIGYDVSAAELQPGQPLDIDLYWQVKNKPPGDYLLFVHLLDQYGSIVAQRDTHPGLGRFPSSQWEPGDRFIERIRLYVPETAYTPSEVRLSVGLYAPGAYRLAVSDSDGSSLGDAYELSTITLQPGDGQYPNPQAQNFNDEIQLAGYEYSQQNLTPDQELELVLYWQAMDEVTGDYQVQVLLVSEDGKIVSSTSSRPQDGASPTDSWKSGDFYIDRHRLSIEPGIEPASYRVDISLHDAASGEALNIIADNGHWIDNHLLLAPVRVTDD